MSRPQSKIDRGTLGSKVVCIHILDIAGIDIKWICSKLVDGSTNSNLLSHGQYILLNVADSFSLTSLFNAVGSAD